ncbi:MAG: ribose-phosphate pyrophosphokinase [Phycisphaerae bacterium]|nr:ribose-phosphate pyrophosphokinase [Phycisphaerae bacterium]NUQ46314.1 ribose-phosphate pyrophosphokinase [Phycisphaerae bacterium]
MSVNDRLLVFPGSGSPRLTEAICRALGIPPGRCETIQFSEGNTFVRIGENVRGADVFIVQTLSYPVNDRFMELLFFIDACKRASAASVTAVIPFFSYGKADKKDEPRVSIRARVCADALEAIGVDRIVTMDLHAPQIQGFFRVPVDHLYALPLIAEAFRGEAGPDLVMVAPDVGFGEMARRYAKALNADYCIAEKIRRGNDENAEVTRIIGDVLGKRTIVVDDFTTSGGTLDATARRLVKEGAISVSAGVSHGVLGKGASARIDAAPLKELVVTDTIEHRAEPLSGKVRVISSAELFARAIRNIHERTSVSTLFEF